MNCADKGNLLNGPKLNSEEYMKPLIIICLIISIQQNCSAQNAERLPFESITKTDDSPPSLSMATSEQIPNSKDRVPNFERPIHNHRVKQTKTIRLSSSKFLHRKLLFEESRLERQGIGQPNQLAVSGTKFFARSVFMPLKILKREHRHLTVSGE